jgi:coniferyl-aldehyde dehydrogenase
MKREPISNGDVEALFDAQRAAYLREPFPEWPERAAHLRTLKRLIETHMDEIAAAIDADFGQRPRQETIMAEVFGSLGGIRDALAHGRRWMRVQRRAPNFWLRPARARLMPQPLGVVGIIVPWNYPLLLAIGPLAAALAAGNRVMIKLSEYAPRYAALMQQLVASHFGADQLVVVTGGADVAQAFSALPFDHILFTGSTQVGRHVMQAASRNLTPVTLELGGKSPALIGSGARFEQAVEAIVAGKLLNAGQTCIAPDYVLVERRQVESFVRAARAAVARLYPDFDRNRDYTTIIDPRHYARLHGLVDEAQLAGATVYELAAGTDDVERRRFLPRCLTNVPESARVMDEEIFGPVLPVVAYDTLDQALAYINAKPRPLALYLFETDSGTIDTVLKRSIAGGVTVNDTLLHILNDNLPFGGVGSSGIGAYHGYDGFVTFSKLKPVLYQARLNGRRLLMPPYGKTFERLMKLMLGR